jgi:transcriptional regulator with XRE-family HTH domain
MPAVNHKLLRERRDELDLSNGDLAGLAKIDYTYLRNIVSGVNKPSMRVIHRLSRALDLPVERIVAAKPTGDPSDPPTQPTGPKSPPKRQDSEKRSAPKRNTAATNALAEAS